MVAPLIYSGMMSVIPKIVTSKIELTWFNRVRNTDQTSKESWFNVLETNLKIYSIAYHAHTQDQQPNEQ